MIKVFRLIYLILSAIRCLPHIAVFYFHPNRAIIRKDLERWLQIFREHYDLPIKLANRNTLTGFLYIITFFREYRNVFYIRVGVYRYLLRIICPEIKSLLIHTKQIGEGFFIQHGFATAIGAKSIGKNCFINQQVTISGEIVIGDNVKINSGAVIIGNLRIGHNSSIGANATVFNDVPDFSSVFPAPPRIMNWSCQNPKSS